MELSFDQIAVMRDILNQIEDRTMQIQALRIVAEKVKNKVQQSDILFDVSDLIEEQENLKAELINLLQASS